MADHVNTSTTALKTLRTNCLKNKFCSAGFN